MVLDKLECIWTCQNLEREMKGKRWMMVRFWVGKNRVRVIEIDNLFLTGYEKRSGKCRGDE